MNCQHNTDELTLYLTQTLTGYELISANFGWHLHKENKYYGLLQYQEKTGWEGSAFNHLPPELQEQLKKFALGVPMPEFAALATA